jgi:hypothetical protein
LTKQFREHRVKKYMLTIVTDKNSIDTSEALFLKSFEPYITARIPVHLGYSGGNIPATVSYSSKLNIWLSREISIDNRYWNGFGIEKPKEGAMIPIICEINFPRKGINRTIGGAFATDEYGQILVMHRGKIGGGRKGIGKNLFKNAYRGKWVDAIDGDIESGLAMIGPLDSQRLPKYVSHFVHEVARIKSLSNTEMEQINRISIKKGFSEEFSGRKKYMAKSDIDAECNHGLVVNELASYLKKEGYNVGNDTNRDLYIFRGQNIIKTLFEIKTDISTTNIYSGVGQLLINSLDYESKPNLVMVIPKEIRNETKDKLAKLGITSLLYGWKEDNPVFTNISSISQLFR